MNRQIFSFNDALDTHFLKPVATFYNKVMPKPLNAGVHNFYKNISLIPTIINDLLQLHFTQLANDLWRISINTTIGIGGLFDIAERIGLPFYTNDFGLTLARWGWQDSIYVVLPFWGTNTLRDALSLPFDYFGFSIYPSIHPRYVRYSVYALGVVDKRAQLLCLQSVLDEAAFDKYTFVRSAYLQRRAFQIEENKCLGFTKRKTPPR